MPNLYLYLVLLCVIGLSVFVDLYLMKGDMSIKKAAQQLCIWVCFSFLFLGILFVFKNQEIALKYFSGYVIEMSLSIDNVFVFILIFKHYKVKPNDSQKLLLIGVCLAIVLRIIFIAAGVELIDKFAWIMYVFGPILIYTGTKIITDKNEAKELKENAFILWIRKHFRFSNNEPQGKYYFKEKNKVFLSTLSLIVILLAVTDFVFALDSIPTIISIVKTNVDTPFSSDERLVIYASNIFAVLGLRALFVILQSMANQFEYLQKAIGLVLVFVGLKMLLEFFHIHFSINTSLLIILSILFLGVIVSKIKNKHSSS